jgi:hypothetical protein
LGKSGNYELSDKLFSIAQNQTQQFINQGVSQAVSAKSQYDAGATYNGQSIKDIPQLRNLYMYIRNNNRMFTEAEIAQLLAQLFSR